MADLTTEQRQLAELMSDISERCYAAGWMQNVEYVLWESLLKGERNYGHGLITTQNIDALKRLSKSSNSWIVFDDQHDETAVDLFTWHQRFQDKIQSNPNILGG